MCTSGSTTCVPGGRGLHTLPSGGGQLCVSWAGDCRPACSSRCGSGGGRSCSYKLTILQTLCQALEEHELRSVPTAQ